MDNQFISYPMGDIEPLEASRFVLWGGHTGGDRKEGLEWKYKQRQKGTNGYIIGLDVAIRNKQKNQNNSSLTR